MKKQNIQTNYYVYIYQNPMKRFTIPLIYEFAKTSFEVDCQPFYVGKGIHNRCYEFQHHNSECLHLIENLQHISENFSQFQIVKILVNNLREANAFSLEFQLIQHFGRTCSGHGLLLNHHPGNNKFWDTPILKFTEDVFERVAYLKIEQKGSYEMNKS